MEVDQVAHIEVEDTKVPFVEKYRPKSLEQIISHTDIVQTSKQKNYLPYFSQKVYRCKEYAALAIPRSARHRQDVLYDSNCQRTLWRKRIQAHDTGTQRQ